MKRILAILFILGPVCAHAMCAKLLHTPFVDYVHDTVWRMRFVQQNGWVIQSLVELATQIEHHHQELGHRGRFTVQNVSVTGDGQVHLQPANESVDDLSVRPSDHFALLADALEVIYPTPPGNDPGSLTAREPLPLFFSQYVHLVTTLDVLRMPPHALRPYATEEIKDLLREAIEADQGDDHASKRWVSRVKAALFARSDDKSVVEFGFDPAFGRYRIKIVERTPPPPPRTWFKFWWMVAFGESD